MSIPQKNQIHFPEVLVLEASAGSGKTYALAQRYIHLLFHPSLVKDPLSTRQVLAITFTNKAAFEMKARILDSLKSMALEQWPADKVVEYLSPLKLTPKEIKLVSFELMEGIIHRYNFFQVQTIDKFINALLSGCALKLDLTANFRIRTNSFDYLEYSVDELIEKAHSDPQLLAMFKCFLDQYLYLENRSGWFPKKEILKTMLTLYRQQNHYGLPFLATEVLPEDLIKLKRSILADFKELLGKLPPETHKTFHKSLTTFVANHPSGFDIDSIKDGLIKEEIPVKKGGTVPDEVQVIWKRVNESLRLLSRLEAYSLFNPYVQIFSRVQQEMIRHSRQDDVVFLEELNKRANELFDKDYVTVEELYYRLATRFHHYLIDEFQDTSRLQWRNMAKMVEEALASGGSLFYVGDRKQAIYGFRGGEVKLFDEVKDGFEHFNLIKSSLTNNWRSQKTIVEFNNHVFSIENLRRFIMQKEALESEGNKKVTVQFSEDDWAALESIFKGSAQTYQPQNDKGLVDISYIDGENKELRYEAIRERLLNLINDLRRRFELCEIAILVRSNREIEDVTNWLMAEGILTASERTSNIKEHHLIQELVCFLKFLDSPIDNLSFVQFIFGEVFTKASGLSIQEMQDFVFALNVRQTSRKELSYVYMEFRDKYPHIWDQYIDPFFRNVGLYPLYELLVSIYGKYKLLEVFPGDQGYFMHFLELIKKEEDEYINLAAMLEYFEKLEGEALFVRVSERNAVQILTIHKSKGLEFPVVILPFLGLNVQVASSTEPNEPKYLLLKQLEGLRLMRLKQKYYAYSDEIYQIYAEEYKKRLLDELSNIYVALTRSEYELYIFVSNKVGRMNNLIRLLIPEDLVKVGQAATYPKSKFLEDQQQSLPPTQCQDWINYLDDEFMSSADISRREKIKRGEVLHAVLSKIVLAGAGSVVKLIDKAFDEVKCRYGVIDDLTEYRKAVEKLLLIPTVKELFVVNDAVVFTEKEIVTTQGYTRRIDRLIIRQDSVDVVDFKSTRIQDDSYVKQVQEYMAHVHSIYPDKKVFGCLVYLDTGEVEVVGEKI